MMQGYRAEAFTSGESSCEEIDFHGAALIDSEGNEIPITDAMVRQTLEQLSCLSDEPLDARH